MLLAALGGTPPVVVVQLGLTALRDAALPGALSPCWLRWLGVCDLLRLGHPALAGGAGGREVHADWQQRRHRV